jgi:glycosyltransferase involved in cell wall biosynthesis
MKNIGFVSYWFNRGQAVVTRYVRSIFDDAGFDTHVLVRRAEMHGTNRGDWVSPNVTIGSKEYNMPVSTYVNWAKENDIEVCFFDQNYQFKAIRSVREMGVRTIGRFVWEQFGEEHVGPAKSAFDNIYSLTRSEQERYNGLGIDSNLVRWGIHPSLFSVKAKRHKDNNVWFYYPAGYCSSRKSVKETVRAFSLVRSKNIRLLISSQKPIDTLGDSRIVVESGNVTFHSEFHKKMASCDVCIIPSRWEGLGLAFVEAMAFGMPIITTNHPPMSEYVVHGKSGLLVKSVLGSGLPNGLPVANIRVKDLSDKISKLSNRALIDKMSKFTVNHGRKKYNWEDTRGDYLAMLRRD